MLRDAVENIEQHLSSTIGFAMEPRTASNTAHSLARLGFAKDSTFADLAEDIIPSLHRWGPRDLSNLVWAYATSGASSAQRVLTSAADAVVNTRDRDGLFQFNTQDISNMTWAFAAAHHSAPHLFDALAARTRELLPRFKPQELSNVLWAHAVLYHSSPELFQEAGSAVSGRWFNLQELGNTAWAYAVFDLLHRHTLRQWVSSVDFKQAAVDDRTNRSLFLAAMAAQHSGNSKMLPLPRSALRSARRCWLGNVEDVKRESQLQRDVMRALQDLGLSCASEVRTPDGAFSVDIMARIVTDGQSRNVAVEVDGPSHFASNVKSKPLGATVLRHRLLRRTVDRLVSVPYFEWSELMGDSALQLAYLKSKLKES